jgi:putative FmdB family regulatory protein
MPMYNYRCMDCGAQDGRIGGLDDHHAVCHKCGGLMWRLDVDPFIKLWDEGERKGVKP